LPVSRLILIVGVPVSTWVADNLGLLELCPSSNLMLSWQPPKPHLLGGPADEVKYVFSYRQFNGSEVNVTSRPYTNEAPQVRHWSRVLQQPHRPVACLCVCVCVCVCVCRCLSWRAWCPTPGMRCD